MGKLSSGVWRFSRTPLKTPYAKSQLRNWGPHLTYQTLALFSKTPDWISFSVSLCNWPAFLTFLSSNQLLGSWSRRWEMPAITPHDKPPVFPSAPQSEEVSGSDIMQGWRIYKFCFSHLYDFVLVSLHLITELTPLCSRRVTQTPHRPSSMAASCPTLSVQGEDRDGEALTAEPLEEKGGGRETWRR